MKNIVKTSVLALIAVTLGLGVGCYGTDPDGPGGAPKSPVDAGTARDARPRPITDRPTRPASQGQEEDPKPEEDELTACLGSHHHGPLSFSAYDVVLGCACGGNRQRNFYHVWNAGGGSCSAIGWASPDPRDCQVRVRINPSGVYANGTCNVQVDASDPADASCNGRCGGRAPSGCYCDAQCSTYGDCCADVASYCPTTNPASCVDHCGGRAPSGCYCDAACRTYNDCCADARPACGV